MSPFRPKPPEFVIDTDVVIAGAAAFRDQPPQPQENEPLETQLVRRWLDGHWRWVTSEELLEEHQEILIRRGAPERRARGYVQFIRESARVVVPRAVKEPLRDPDDSHVIGTVRAAGAPLVTRNVEDYLGRRPRVLTPEETVREVDSYLRHPMVKISRLLGR